MGIPFKKGLKFVGKRVLDIDQDKIDYEKLASAIAEGVYNGIVEAMKDTGVAAIEDAPNPNI